MSYKKMMYQVVKYLDLQNPEDCDYNDFMKETMEFETYAEAENYLKKNPVGIIDIEWEDGTIGIISEIYINDDMVEHEYYGYDLSKFKFKSKGHRKFVERMSRRIREDDIERFSLFYILGISESVREHINDVYDSEDNCIIPECLLERPGWMTSVDVRIIKLAFHLYSGSTPSANLIENAEEKELEIKAYLIDCIFCGDENDKWLLEGIKVRYEIA